MSTFLLLLDTQCVSNFSLYKQCFVDYPWTYFFSQMANDSIRTNLWRRASFRELPHVAKFPLRRTYPLLAKPWVCLLPALSVNTGLILFNKQHYQFNRWTTITHLNLHVTSLLVSLVLVFICLLIISISYFGNYKAFLLPIFILSVYRMS